MTNAATATYKILNSTTAIVTVDYSNGSFGMERVTRARNGSLYEAAYAAAAVKAGIQGDRLDRFSEEA